VTTKKTGRARSAKPKPPAEIAKQETALARALRDNLGIGPVSAASLAATIHSEIWRLIHQASEIKEARDNAGSANGAAGAARSDDKGEQQGKGEPTNAS